MSKSSVPMLKYEEYASTRRKCDNAKCRGSDFGINGPRKLKRAHIYGNNSMNSSHLQIIGPDAIGGIDLTRLSKRAIDLHYLSIS